MRPMALAPVGVALVLTGLGFNQDPAARYQSATAIVIEADRVMTMGPAASFGPGVVVVCNGQIEAVGRADAVKAPLDALRLRARVVTPGLIDARTTLGLTGVEAFAEDHNEKEGPNQAAIRAIDAFRFEEPLVAAALRSGVTTLHAGPGAINPIAGQAGLFKTSAQGLPEAVVAFPSAVVLAFTEAAKTTYGGKAAYPSTRMATVGLIRQALVDAQHQVRRATAGAPGAEGAAAPEGSAPELRSLAVEAMASLVTRDRVAFLAADRADEISTALRVVEEFGLRAVVFGGREAGIVADRLARSKVPVVLTPASRDLSVQVAPGERGLAALLSAKGISFAYGTGDVAGQGAMRLLDVAAGDLRTGLAPEQAIAALTISAARILSVDARLGSLEVGKDADMVLFDGDPLQPATKVIAVLVNGKLVVGPNGGGVMRPGRNGQS